eukprot:UN23438
MVKKFRNDSPESFSLKIPMLYLDRWLRLLPCIAFAVLIYAYILPNIGDGPLWPYADKDRICVNGWWPELLLLTSWPQGTDANEKQWSDCLGVTWYLTCDYFYFALIPFIVIMYKKTQKTLVYLLPWRV